MKFKYKKYLSLIIKVSGYITSFALTIAFLAQNSTCFAIYYQPKMPKSLIESDAEE